jgi:hypothetical protein
LVSAGLSTRPGDDDSKIEIVDPKNPKKMIEIKERYPGEAQWYFLPIASSHGFRLDQVAAAEEQMRAEGKIDEEGHLTHHDGKVPTQKKTKKQEE